MSTLKSFQAEIARISDEKHKLAIKEAKEAHAAAELARHHGRPPPTKKDTTAVANASDSNGEGSSGPDAPIVVSQGSIHRLYPPFISAHVRVRPSGRGSLRQPCTFTTKGTEANGAHAQDLLLSDSDDHVLISRLQKALSKGHGEVLIVLGAHPSPTDTYNPPDPPVSPIPTVGEALTAQRLQAILGRLRAACDSVSAHLNQMYLVDDAPQGPYGVWLARSQPRGVEEIMEVRVAVVGNVDAGKSTTLGVLTRGSLDDGRGKARVALFRHPHEIETGRTSSVGGEILGFSPTGEPVIPSQHTGMDPSDPHAPILAASKREKLGWEEICSRAAKVVSFIDLAGHERCILWELRPVTR